MGHTITLQAADGHTLAGYRADPTGPAKGGIVVIQEVFGVNPHIRDVCDRFAGHGFSAIAPALFDRVERGVELDYDEAGVARGRELAAAIGWDHPMTDIWAAAMALHPQGKVGTVGYCWGGSWSWLAACRTDVACAVVYYGRHIPEFPDDAPRCPAIIHFGESDDLIPEENRDTVKARYPDVPMHLYPAGHGFNCDRRASFHPASAALALTRTLEFYARHLG